MTTNYLKKNDFYFNTGLSKDDVNDNLVANLIKKTNALIDLKLGKIFTLSSNYSQVYTVPNHTKTVFVGVWQKTSLVVKRGSRNESVSDFETLTEDVDYYLESLEQDDPNNIYPCTMVKFLCPMDDYDAIQLSGTYGYGDDVPADCFLDTDLYEIIKGAVLNSGIEATTAGRGRIKSSTIDKVKTDFMDTNESGMKIMSAGEAMNVIGEYINNVAKRYVPQPDYFATVIG